MLSPGDLFPPKLEFPNEPINIVVVTRFRTRREKGETETQKNVEKLKKKIFFEEISDSNSSRDQSKKIHTKGHGKN
jgi:hypothetical protein